MKALTNFEEAVYVKSPKIIINSSPIIYKYNYNNNTHFLDRKKRIFSEMESQCDKNEFTLLNEMFEKKFKFCSQ